MDLGTQFCERCGRDRDSFASNSNAYHDCPACGAACCADCWNLVDGACLACAPFRLTDATARPRIVIPATQPSSPVAGAADPYADLRVDATAAETWSSRPAARQRAVDAPPAGDAPTVAPDAWRAVVAQADPPPRSPRRRAGRIGLAASAAWLVVGALAVAALGATPGSRPPAAVEATPSPTPAPTPAPTAAPTAPPPSPTPRPTRKPRTATPRPVAVPGIVPQVTPRPTPKPTPKPTKRPPKPVVVTPPPATPAPTPDLDPEATPDP